MGADLGPGLGEGSGPGLGPGLGEGNGIRNGSASILPPSPPPPPPLPLKLLADGTSNPNPPTRAKSLPLLPPPPPPLPPSMNLKAKNTLPPPPPPLPVSKPKVLEEKSRPVVELVKDPNTEKLDQLKHLKRSQTKLKQVHWDKIENISNTLWSDSDDQNINKILDERGILAEIENSFKVKEVIVKKKRTETTKEPQSSKLTFLPRDLKQTFAINLHQFNTLSAVDFVKKVLSCDPEVTKASHVIEFFNNESAMELTPNLMKDLGPYSTNYKLGKTVSKKNPNELERYDRIYVELCYNLSSYWKARSRALFVAITYESDYNDIIYRLNLLQGGLDKLKSSKSLVEILALIKNIGNFMNDDSKIALGFKLSTLQRLRFLKDTTNKMSMMQYVEKTVRTHFPEYKDFANSLSDVNKIATLNIDDVQKSVEDFISLINSSSRQIKNGSLSDKSKLHPDDKIIEYFGKIMDHAQKKALDLKERFDYTMDNLETTMTYYAEDFNDKNSKNTFFMKFVSFVAEYKQAHMYNIRMEDEEKKRENRKKSSIKNSKHKKKKEIHESKMVEQIMKLSKEKHKKSSNNNLIGEITEENTDCDETLILDDEEKIEFSASLIQNENIKSKKEVEDKVDKKLEKENDVKSIKEEVKQDVEITKGLEDDVFGTVEVSDGSEEKIDIETKDVDDNDDDGTRNKKDGVVDDKEEQCEILNETTTNEELGVIEESENIQECNFNEEVRITENLGVHEEVVTNEEPEIKSEDATSEKDRVSEEPEIIEEIPIDEKVDEIKVNEEIEPNETEIKTYEESEDGLDDDGNENTDKTDGIESGENIKEIHDAEETAGSLSKEDEGAYEHKDNTQYIKESVETTGNTDKKEDSETFIQYTKRDNDLIDL